MLTRSQSVVRYLVGSYRSPSSRLGPLLRAIPLNQTTRQLLELSRPEQFGYLESLWRFNCEVAKSQASAPARSRSAAAIYKIRKTAGLIRRFNQLPCTVESRERRADLLADMDKSTCRILVLGDDDLLSVELARRGFANVTAADCDELLLERIRLETKDLATPPRLVNADFSKGYSGLADEPMDVVFLDPPYTPEGARAFLKLATEATAGAPAGKIYLMINPGVFGAAFREITNMAVRSGFRLVRQRGQFNAYPLGAIETFFLVVAWRFLLGCPVPRMGKTGFLFCSDCFEFEREGQRS